MLQNCRRTKTHSWRPVRKANKTKSCSGESEIFGHDCLQTTTLNNQSAAEKFSVLSCEFYNFPTQLPHFGTWWHCFELLCLCPLSFLSSPFLVLATLHRDFYKMTENHLHSFSSSSSCQLTGWSWCPGGFWMMYYNRRGVRHSYCPSVRLQDEKPGDCWGQSKSSPSLGLLTLQLPAPQLWGSRSPFLSSVLSSRLRLGVLLVWGTDFQWVAHC